jgi:hypothetical protein
VTVQFVAVVGLSLVLLVLVADVCVHLYARAAVRDALDEGVRAAAVAGGDDATCERRARDVLHGLLRGSLGRRVRVECRVDGPWVVARARGSFPPFLPSFGVAWPADATALALRSP